MNPVPTNCPLDIDPIVIGRLIQKIETLEDAVRSNSEKVDMLEQQLHRTKGIGIGIVLATVGLSGVGGSLIAKWLG